MNSTWYAVDAIALNSGHLECTPRSLELHSTDGCALCTRCYGIDYRCTRVTLCCGCSVPFKHNSCSRVTAYMVRRIRLSNEVHVPRSSEYLQSVILCTWSEILYPVMSVYVTNPINLKYAALIYVIFICVYPVSTPYILHMKWSM